jgi:transcriptional regulator with XRE-family HTH domain
MPVFDGLGKALRWLREKQGRRQYELAEAAHVTKAMLSAYETDKQRPALETLERILDALGADLATLGDALDHVNERPRARARSGSRVGGAEHPAAGGVDVCLLLGVPSLPSEEEESMRQMLLGFHRFLRYLHRTRREQGGGDAGAA